jgi:predicted nucleotide-binding protein
LPSKKGSSSSHDCCIIYGVIGQHESKEGSDAGLSSVQGVADVEKPNVFIGSSRESIELANAIHSQIKPFAQVTPWYAGAFSGNEYTMESLEKQLDASDFGIFVFAPDDVALYRGKYVFITRDNTLFELGLFWGKLRRKRVFAIVPEAVKERDALIKGEKVKDFHLLSDLQGLTLLKYELRTDGNDEASVSIACQHITKKIKEEGFYRDPSIKLKDAEVEIERKISLLRFFWIYNKNVPVRNETDHYNALSEAIRASFHPPPGFVVTGAAIWRTQGNDGIGQVGGNVGKGRFFKFDEHQSRMMSGQQPIYVLDAYLNSKWSFFNRLEVEQVYVLCYPLGKEHVLCIHFSGHDTLDDDQLSLIITTNNELLRTVNLLVGGDSV